MTTKAPPEVVRPPELPWVAKVPVPVPIVKPGNVVGRLLTFFDVYGDGTAYKAVTIGRESQKILGHLPDAIHFKLKEGKIDVDSCYRFIVADIVNELHKNGY